jgi:hypothetical protein
VHLPFHSRPQYGVEMHRCLARRRPEPRNSYSWVLSRAWPMVPHMRRLNGSCIGWPVGKGEYALGQNELGAVGKSSPPRTGSLIGQFAHQLQQTRTGADMPVKKIIQPAGIAEAVGPFSRAILIDDSISPVQPRSRTSAVPVHWDIDPARMMRLRFADSIRASSPSGLREQAGHMTASDFCAARSIFSCHAGAIHT